MNRKLRDHPGVRQLLHMAAGVPWVLPLYRGLRGLLDPHRRALYALTEQEDGPLLQWSGTTFADRYPPYFEALQRELRGVERPRILSFGCSTGEEVFTLRRYFPEAELTGIDINPHAIDVAKRNLAKRGQEEAVGMTFRCAGSLADEPEGHYDAILAMAVLRHGELHRLRPPTCTAFLRFDKVERAVEDLARCLKPGGLLLVSNTQFRVIDMACAARFEVALSDPLGLTQPDPIYGPDDRLRDDPANCEVMFRKVG